MLIAYLIIGVTMFTLTSISMAIRDPEKMKSGIREWQFWVATITCALVWPLIVLLALSIPLGRFLRRIGL